MVSQQRTSSKRAIAVADIDIVRQSLKSVKRSAGFIQLAIRRVLKSTKLIQRMVRKHIRERQEVIWSVLEDCSRQEQSHNMETDETGNPSNSGREEKLLVLQCLYSEKRSEFRSRWREWRKDIICYQQLLHYQEQVANQRQQQFSEPKKYDMITPLKNKLAALRARKPFFTFTVTLQELASLFVSHTRKILVENLCQTMNVLNIETSNPELLASMVSQIETRELNEARKNEQKEIRKEIQQSISISPKATETVTFEKQKGGLISGFIGLGVPPEEKAKQDNITIFGIEDPGDFSGTNFEKCLSAFRTPFLPPRNSCRQFGTPSKRLAMTHRDDFRRSRNFFYRPNRRCHKKTDLSRPHSALQTTCQKNKYIYNKIFNLAVESPEKVNHVSLDEKSVRSHTARESISETPIPLRNSEAARQYDILNRGVLTDVELMKLIQDTIKRERAMHAKFNRSRYNRSLWEEPLPCDPPLPKPKKNNQPLIPTIERKPTFPQTTNKKRKKQCGQASLNNSFYLKACCKHSDPPKFVLPKAPRSVCDLTPRGPLLVTPSGTSYPYTRFYSNDSRKQSDLTSTSEKLIILTSPQRRKVSASIELSIHEAGDVSF